MQNLFPKLLPLAFLFVVHSGVHAGVVADHPGYWMGNVTLPDGQVLNSGIALFKRADGSAWASFSVPDQGAYDIPVRSIEEKGDTVALRLDFGEMTMTWAGTHFKAEWAQAGKSFPLKLEQVAGFPRKPRCRRRPRRFRTPKRRSPSAAPMASPSAPRCPFPRASPSRLS